MDALLKLLVELLVSAFVVGSAGCVILIPVVAIKFVSVLFEADPGDATLAQQ